MATVVSLPLKVPNRSHLTEEEEKGDPPRGQSPARRPTTPDISEIQSSAIQLYRRDLSGSNRSSASTPEIQSSAVLSLWGKFCSAISAPKISPAAKECIKNLKNSSETSDPFWSVYLQDFEHNQLATWAETISRRHLIDFHLPSRDYDSDCPSLQECPSFQEFYQRDLRQIARYSKMAASFVEDSDTSIRERIAQESEKIRSLYKECVENAFSNYGPAETPPDSAQKPTPQTLILAMSRAVLDLLEHHESPSSGTFTSEEAAITLMAVSDCVLAKLTGQTYTKLAKTSLLDFDAKNPFLGGVIRKFHPLIMKRLQEFARPLDYGSVDLASTSFLRWHGLARSLQRNHSH